MTLKEQIERDAKTILALVFMLRRDIPELPIMMNPNVSRTIQASVRI